MKPSYLVFAVLTPLFLLSPQLGTLSATATPDTGKPWTNSLGEKFVPAGTDGVLFCIWDVRVKDFAAFVRATGYDAIGGMYSVGTDGWQQRGNSWKSPGFAQTDDCPVVGVNWDDAKEFCRWLTKKERAEGMLASNQQYRLPTDAEWSKAAGLNESSGGTPASKNKQIKDVYPWGTQWPPPAGAGNYAGGEAKDAKWPDKLPTIPGYNDGYPRTSPVGSFAANQYGLYDMGGNVWQWSETQYDAGIGERVLRGAAWFSFNNDPQFLLSSYRASKDPGHRSDGFGFRVVVVVSSPDSRD